MTSSAEQAETLLRVIIPVGKKRARDLVESQIADALVPNSNISKIHILSDTDQQGRKGSISSCSFLGKWLQENGAQLTELVLSMDEAAEVKIVASLFQCRDCQLTRLLVSAADFPPDLLQKLPATLEVFSGHLGRFGDLTICCSAKAAQHGSAMLSH